MRSFSRRVAAASAVSRSAVAVIAATLSLVLSVSTSNPAAAMNIQKVTSPGGIEAWLVEEHSVPLMAMRYAFDGGSSQDPAGKEGLANFLTAMMDEGAGDLKSEAYQERMEDLAMRMRYEDSKDSIYGSFETLTVNRDKAVDLLKLSVQTPRFDDDAVVRIRQQLLANLAYADKDPDKVALREWYAQAFAGHPYARPSNGTMATVSNITHDDLAAYHKRTFARDNLKVAVVGDITPAQLGKLIDDVFGALPAKADLTPVAKTEPLLGGSQQVIEMGVPQSVAMFGLGAMPRKDPDFMAAFVVNHILGGGGFSAKLMEEVREKRGLAYSVYTYIQPDQHTSILLGSVATKNASMAESLDIIRKELQKMAEQGPTPADLDAAKSYLTGSYALRFDTNSKIAAQLLGLMQEGFGPDYVENRNKMIDAVTLADAKRVAARLLKPENLIVTIVGRPAGLKSATPAAMQPALAVPGRG
jgi:zinc protease